MCARTDAFGSEGTTFDDALTRCVAYATEGGADLLWLNSVESREQLRAACAAVPVPVLTIWGGATPRPTLEEFAELGASAVLFPTIASTAAAQATWELLHEFRASGDVALEAWSAHAAASPWGRVATADLVGTPEVRALEERYLSGAHQRDYETTFGHQPT